MVLFQFQHVSTSAAWSSSFDPTFTSEFMAGFGLSDNELGFHQALYAGALLHESSEEICLSQL